MGYHEELEKEMAYEQQMAIETLFVGTGNVASFLLIQRLFPQFSPVTNTFFAGVFFHLFSEFSGLNEWYLTNGAASYYADKQEPEYFVIPEKSHKCHRPSFTGYAGQSSWEEASMGLPSCLRYTE
jgi:hypothetical protein